MSELNRNLILSRTLLRRPSKRRCFQPQREFCAGRKSVFGGCRTSTAEWLLCCYFRFRHYRAAFVTATQLRFPNSAVLPGVGPAQIEFKSADRCLLGGGSVGLLEHYVRVPAMWSCFPPVENLPCGYHCAGLDTRQINVVVARGDSPAVKLCFRLCRRTAWTRVWHLRQMEGNMGCVRERKRYLATVLQSQLRTAGGHSPLHEEGIVNEYCDWPIN